MSLVLEGLRFSVLGSFGEGRFSKNGFVLGKPGFLWDFGSVAGALELQGLAEVRAGVGVCRYPRQVLR